MRYTKIKTKIKDIEVDAIQDSVDSKLIFFWNSILFETSLTGKIISQKHLSLDEKYFFNSDDICHNPPEYINNKRDCGNCKHIVLCNCNLNKYRINKIDESLKFVINPREEPEIIEVALPEPEIVKSKNGYVEVDPTKDQK